MTRGIPFGWPGLIGKCRSIFLSYSHWSLTGLLGIMKAPKLFKPKHAHKNRNRTNSVSQFSPATHRWPRSRRTLGSRLLGDKVAILGPSQISVRVSLTSKEVERCCFAVLLRFKVIYLWGATNPFSTARLVWNDIPFGGLHKQQHTVSICLLFLWSKDSLPLSISVICVYASPTSLNYCHRLQVFFCRIGIENVIDGIEVGILVTMSKNPAWVCCWKIIHTGML